MPLDPGLVGTTYPPTTYEVGREKIREFAEAIGAAADASAPPTFPIVITLAASHRALDQLGVELHNVLHREQRFTYTRPVRVGDVLTCSVTIEDIKVVAGTDMVTVRADLTSADEDIATVRTTLVVGS